MKQVGFFTKQTIGGDEPAVKKSGARKPAAAKVAHDLPPVLRIRVPVAEKKVRQVKQFAGDKPQVELDIECYINYFLVKFRQADGSYIEFEMDDNLHDGILDRKGIRKVLADNEVISFNGNHFDLPLLKYALQVKDCTTADLKAVADDIIKNELSVYKFEKKHGLKDIDCDHIDLSPQAPMMTSLKLCGARLHCEHLQDLPYTEDTVLTAEQMDVVNEYCGNDLKVTAALKTNLAEEIELRRILSKQYGVDVRSKSDAQIAEEIIKAEVLKRTGIQVKKLRDSGITQFNYQIPDFIVFTNPELNAVLDILRDNEFVAKPVNNGIEMPDQLKKLEIKIGGQTYRMGIGGLHSSEKSAFHIADNEYSLWDWDVTSYYPSIILQCGLYPKTIGKVFLDIYEELVDKRLAAKAAGNKVDADSLKITVNGAFGKLGSPWSVLYAPNLMIQVTVTGQLSLLMLIDTFTHHGFDVVSGNTDGIVIKCRRSDEELMHRIIARWQARTGFNMEFTNYAGLYSRDINNYIAIAVDGRVKSKGCFEYAGLKKNPEYDICTDALVAYFKRGTPVEETIRACTDIRKFISARQVNGGAVKAGEYLGRVVRWYYSTDETGHIAYKTNGNKVPQSDGARPVMTLPVKFPGDVNYDWYVQKCKDLFY